jgi:peptidoglycan/LPS O-acetylase OafA/YrhL
VALFFALSFGVGILAAWIIERPFLALRDRWLPTRSRSLAAAAPVVETALDPGCGGMAAVRN